jgi:hypothetical protein
MRKEEKHGTRRLMNMDVEEQGEEEFDLSNEGGLCDDMSERDDWKRRIGKRHIALTHAKVWRISRTWRRGMKKMTYIAGQPRSLIRVFNCRQAAVGVSTMPRAGALLLAIAAVLLAAEWAHASYIDPGNIAFDIIFGFGTEKKNSTSLFLPWM